MQEPIELRAIGERQFRVSNTLQKCYIGLQSGVLTGQEDDGVYVVDVSDYLGRHPGGDVIMLMNAGKDATKEFRDVRHSESALSEARRRIIGKIISDAQDSNVLVSDTEKQFEQQKKQKKLKAQINKYIRIVAGTLIVGTIVLVGLRYFLKKDIAIPKQIQALRQAQPVRESI